MEILDKHPNLKKIKCPRSLYLRTSSKYIQALSQLGVEVEPMTKKGRPRKYGEGQINTIKKMIKQGKAPLEISKKMHLPVKSVYYLQKSPLKRGRKRKYGESIEREVKKLHSRGSSAREISERLKIPLRTVYSLIKR